MRNLLLAIVCASLCFQSVLAEGKCKVSKVRAVCESKCEEDTRPVERTSVPPPGTLLPPSGMSQGASEGTPPASPPADESTPVNSASLLEIESQTNPAVTVTKGKDGKFSPENAKKAVSQVGIPSSLSDVHAARLLFATQDIQNLNEASHFASSDNQAMLHPPMTCEDVEAHISPVPLLTWVDAHKASFGCADGRSAEEGLGTWGGDFGEFLTALNVYEQMASIHLSQEDVTSIFRKYLGFSNRAMFTTCMSGMSVRQLLGSFGDNPEFAIKNPPEEKRAALWMKIADPDFIGNDHVKFMLENPSGYSVRKELAQHFIHSFFDIYWNSFDPLSSKLRVQVLPGEHSERAVVSVTVPDFCLKQAGLAAQIAPRLLSTSMVVLNPDAVQVMRRELSLFFSREPTPVVRSDEMNKRFNVLAAGQGALTKKMMYDRIPTYSAKISS